MSNLTKGTKIYFSDYFNVSPKSLKKYGAFNISLVADMPLFVDPFLLFHSNKKEYQKLHNDIIKYVTFLRSKSISGGIAPGLRKTWFTFPEVKENWLGYSAIGNQGTGLGPLFAKNLHDNLGKIFRTFGKEQITKSSHLEKLMLFDSGIGKDHISDFTVNLIKGFLLQYTQEFANKFIDKKFIKRFPVRKTKFNYRTEVWESGEYNLPVHNNEFILLTPKDILSREKAWINRQDMIDGFELIPAAISNEEIRAQISNYFLGELPDEPKKVDRQTAAVKTIKKFPQLIDYYIKSKEEHGDRAHILSHAKIKRTEGVFIDRVAGINQLLASTDFYKLSGDSYKEAMQRVKFLKHVIEKQDGYKCFYYKGKSIHKEEDLQIMYRLAWFAPVSDVNREVNNGRGPVDFKISQGSKDSTLVEFKLASNSHLRRNLLNQLKIYEEANDTNQGITVIVFFSEKEEKKVKALLTELGMEKDKNIILIDARNDNKPSGSKA